MRISFINETPGMEPTEEAAYLSARSNPRRATEQYHPIVEIWHPQKRCLNQPREDLAPIHQPPDTQAHPGPARHVLISRRTGSGPSAPDIEIHQRTGQNAFPGFPGFASVLQENPAFK